MHDPREMTVVEISAHGGPEGLGLGRRQRPSAGAGEVLIEVAAAGVNRPDVLQRMGLYPPPPGTSDLPGLEVAGTVAEVGEGVSGFSLGQGVCALLTGGGYADYAVAPAPQCLTIPDGLSMIEAASLPETAFTVWHNVFDRASFRAGETVLVHGGTSGIGVMAIQMVSALGGQAIATAGSAQKAQACLDLGAVAAVDYTAQDFVQVVKDVTGGRGADIILDMVGGDYLPRNVDAAAIDGRIAHIAFLRGAKAQLDLPKVMQKRLIVTGSMLRGRSVADKGRIAHSLREKVWPLIAAGEIRPVVHAVFAFGEAPRAHALMESSTHIGKIVLTPTGA
jgi:putative PIG3 family NAD(P)H quinone oxidoreductase